ncbi:MAG: YggS family pyridoxal phosphate-dependent enzyme [Lachnospiraceae bacterium]
MIADNLKCVQERICAACQRVGRDPKEVTLIAVSKTKPVEMLQEAYDAGSRHFGENKVQELSGKIEQMPEDIHWHMIGHLQTNKIKYIIGKTTLIHSVDSLHLAEAISKESVKKNVITDVLIEVNVGEEDTKFGTTVEETIELVENISKLPGICVKGLMTIAPFVENAEENRQIFQKLRKLSIDIELKDIDNVSMNILSMGMTNDYEVAVEEGATLVRVGTGIFGERNYMK